MAIGYLALYVSLQSLHSLVITEYVIDQTELSHLPHSSARKQSQTLQVRDWSNTDNNDEFTSKAEEEAQEAEEAEKAHEAQRQRRHTRHRGGRVFGHLL